MAEDQQIKQGITERPLAEKDLLPSLNRELVPVLRRLREYWNAGVGTSDAMAAPTMAGQLLVAVEVNGVLRWERVDPGAPGDVLTIGAGGLPEWA